MKPWLASTPVVATAALFVALAGIEAAHTVEGRGKLAEARLPDASRQDIVVRLAVNPEQFHMSRLQRWGVMVGAEGRAVRLRAVPAAALPTIARQPWVAGLSPLGGA